MSELSLIERIDADLRQAMREKDEAAKLALRSIKAALTEASKAGKAQRSLTDEEALQVIARLAKQRREAMAEFEKAGRAALAAREEAELAVLQRYLPEPLSPAEIEGLARQAIQETGARSPRDMGRVMSALMPRVRGRAEGKVVSQIVRRLLSDPESP